MQLPHQRREQLGLGGRQLGEAKHAAAGAVRARAVRDAVASLARPKGAELRQVAVIVGRVRVVARESGQLLEVGTHRRGSPARVELLVALQRARRERLALVLPVKLLVDVGAGHLDASHAPLAALACAGQLVADRHRQVVLHVHEADLADVLRNGNLGRDDGLLVARLGAGLPAEGGVRPARDLALARVWHLEHPHVRVGTEADLAHVRKILAKCETVGRLGQLGARPSGSRSGSRGSATG
mmetsp:Transcript_29000/g.92750  ORF Transcript_29000/g.92750 Transcript_29000/m.92750 type:complete len:241 (-) Transcript_29000:51-773(-)